MCSRPCIPTCTVPEITSMRSTFRHSRPAFCRYFAKRGGMDHNPRKTPGWAAPWENQPSGFPRQAEPRLPPAPGQYAPGRLLFETAVTFSVVVPKLPPPQRPPTEYLPGLTFLLSFTLIENAPLVLRASEAE